MSKHEVIPHRGIKLDEEELEFEAAIARGEYVETKTRAEAQLEWSRGVDRLLRKKPITVRLQEEDIRRLKVIALEQGIPYQTLMSSVIHRFATGQLKGNA